MNRLDETGSMRNGDKALIKFLSTTEDELPAKYAEIRRKLIHFFVYRGFSDYDELADRTIFEVVEGCPRFVDSYAGDPLLWIYGVARNVLKQASKSTSPVQAFPEPDPPEEKEARDICLRRCMNERLNDADRALILEYYRGDRGAKIEHRKRLATILETTENGLRLRTFHIRNRLRDCVSRCLTAQGFM